MTFTGYFSQEISHVRNQSETSASCELVATNQLNSSVCRSTFPHWNLDKSANKAIYRNISVSGCGKFEKVERDLKFAQKLVFNNLPTLLDRLMLLLCHYAFDKCPKDIGYDKLSKTKAICAEISKLKLNNILKIAPWLGISCLSIPKCTRSELQGKNVSSCPAPLIPTRTNFARNFGLYCSPPCDRPTSKTGATIFKIILYVSVLFYWISIAVVLITWIKAKNLYASIRPRWIRTK